MTVGEKNRNSIVFMVAWPIRTRDLERFGFRYWRSEGFDVKVFDLSPLLNARALPPQGLPEEVKDESFTKVYRLGELHDLVKRHMSKSIFIDFVSGISEKDFQTAAVFRVLKKHSVPYLIILTGSVPSSPTLPAKNFRERLARSLKSKNRFAFLERRIVGFLNRNCRLLPQPAFIFSPPSERVERFMELSGISRSRLVPCHSLDYDRFLEYQRTETPPAVTKDYCLFLDEAATHHLDFNVLGLKPASATYFEKMNRLFDEIEARTNLPVLIAAHPHSNYDSMPGVFGNRRIIKAKTIELVMGSQFVIAHSSTSINFAVLAEKPILIVWTDSMKNGYQEHFVNAMASALGLSPLKIDEKERLESYDFNFQKWAPPHFNEYRSRYIMSEAECGKTSWELIRRKISQSDLSL